MTIVSENIIKAAHRLFLLLILISIVLLAPWPQQSDDSPGSLLEWISAHISHKSNSKHATTAPHNYHSSNHKHDYAEGDINSKFLHGLARGFYDVGIVIVVWFTVMCILGSACRAYLCIEDCWNRRFYSVLPLYREHGEDETYVEDEDDRSVEGEFSMRDMREEQGVVERDNV
jgi:hypothetical protein